MPPIIHWIKQLLNKYVQILASTYHSITTLQVKLFNRLDFTVDEKFSKYRSLQILSILNNEWPVGHNVIMILQIMCNALLISLRSKMSTNMLGSVIVSFLLFTVFEKVCTRASAQVYMKSLEIFLENAGKMSIAQTEKYCKISETLAVYVGSYYFIKVSTFTTYISTVVENMYDCCHSCDEVI